MDSKSFKDMPNSELSSFYDSWKEASASGMMRQDQSVQDMLEIYRIKSPNLVMVDLETDMLKEIAKRWKSEQNNNK